MMNVCVVRRVVWCCVAHAVSLSETISTTISPNGNGNGASSQPITVDVNVPQVRTNPQCVQSTVCPADLHGEIIEASPTAHANTTPLPDHTGFLFVCVVSACQWAVGTSSLHGSCLLGVSHNT